MYHVENEHGLFYHSYNPIAYNNVYLCDTDYHLFMVWVPLKGIVYSIKHY